MNNDILNAVKGYADTMQSPVTFVLQLGEHAKREELRVFLSQLAEVSENIILEERETQTLRSPISFLIEVEGKDTGVRFSGIPSGHEFNSLILAMLQASGSAIKLDDSLKNLVLNIKEPIHFEVFVSLSCHNCPDVVQAVNQFALLNSHITSEMIDGGLFQEVISQRDIQGVPSVYANGEIFANGKVTAAELIEKLIERDPSITQTTTHMKKMPLQDVVVIGGGPAGVSAAIYSARKGLNVTMIANRFGGQVKDTMGIENLISVSQTTGPELTGALHAHMNDYEITFKEHLSVNKVEGGDIKKVHLSSGEVVQTKTVIVATGAKWRELGVPGEKENVGNGVAYCPHCDGPFFKGKDIAVIGGGNSGVEAALDLASIVKSVTLFEFSSSLKADEVLVRKAMSYKNIEIITSAATEKINAKADKVTSIDYINRETNEKLTKDLEGVFVQIGLLPNSGFLGDLVELTPAGEIHIDDKCRTSEAGIYACGDVTTVPYKQIIISMGEGAKASLAAFEYLIANNEQLDDIYQGGLEYA